MASPCTGCPGCDAATLELPDGLQAAARQPFGVEIHTADGVFVKQMVVPDAFTLIPQHSHRFAHLTMLAAGSVRVWCDGNLRGDFAAPTGITIEAETKHLFQTLEPATVLYCVHHLGQAEHVEILEEHQIVEAA